MRDRLEKNAAADVLEQGDVFFFYPSRLLKPPVLSHGEEDLERFFMVLRPAEESHFRFILLGKKRLPPSGRGGARFWGLVAKVAGTPEEARTALLGKARSGRAVSPRRGANAIRSAGKGIYAIARHGNHVHLAYSLERPVRAGPIQKELGIEEEASFILNVKNPDVIEGAEKPGYPAPLRDLFRGRKYLPADPVAFMDSGNAELLFIAVRRAVEKELGIRFRREEERREEAYFL